MPMLCALDWRQGHVAVGVSQDPAGGFRVALGHGPDELVLHCSRETLDALTLAGTLCPRPTGSPPWDPSLLNCS